jgi:uncharacterized repeat protein (TIGR04052 family)
MLAMTALLPLLSGCFGSSLPGDPVEISFAARVGDTPFSCSTGPLQFDTNGPSVEITDLRMFLHDFVLIAADGSRTPMLLENDGIWQSGGAALLDFEDGSGACTNGSGETRTQVVGSTSAGDFTAIEFRLGLPFAINHRNPAKAPSPLNLTAMHWNWLGGYKFLRLGASIDGRKGYRAHLGSTGCQGTIGNVSSCLHENRATFRVDGVASGKNTVVFDLARLLKGTEVFTGLSNNDQGSLGCMGDEDDPGCQAIFANLGLPSSFEQHPKAAQAFLVP